MTRLAELAVGDELAPITLPRISPATLAVFASASGDDNPIHLNADAARAAGESDVLAHGMLSMAYLGRLLTGAFDQASLRSWTVRFVAKTPVNAEVTCRATVGSLPDRPGGELALEIRAELADGTVTLLGSARLLAPILRIEDVR
jgi:acyl dehydratase